MTNLKKILITTETREIFIARVGREKTIRLFCAGCRRDAEMLTLDQTVHDSGRRTRELVRLADAGAIHSLETTDGHLLFCRASVEEFLTSEKL